MRLTSYLPGELIPLPSSGSIPELPHVAEVGDDQSWRAGANFLSLPPAIHSLIGEWSDITAAELCTRYAKHGCATGGGRTTSFASLRRFCAIAASVNSN